MQTPRQRAADLFAAGKVQEADAVLTAAIAECDKTSDDLGELHLKRAQCRIVLASKSRELEKEGFPLELDHLASWELVLADAWAANQLTGSRAALEASAVAVDNLTLLLQSSSSSHQLDSLLHAAAADIWDMVAEECGLQGQRGEKAAARRDEQRAHSAPLSPQDTTRLVEGLLSEPRTTPAHAIVEHAVGLTYHRLGCRGPHREWRPYHLATSAGAEGGGLREDRLVEAMMKYRLGLGMDGEWAAKGLAKGTLCRLHALEGRQDLNGRCGEVLHYDGAAKRYAMAVLPVEAGGETLQCRVHEKNLRPAAAY